MKRLSFFKRMQIKIYIILVLQNHRIYFSIVPHHKEGGLDGCWELAALEIEARGHWERGLS
jgi:hypothetical protein